jgi:hypothetical protein
MLCPPLCLTLTGPAHRSAEVQNAICHIQSEVGKRICFRSTARRSRDVNGASVDVRTRIESLTSTLKLIDFNVDHYTSMYIEKQRCRTLRQSIARLTSDTQWLTVSNKRRKCRKISKFALTYQRSLSFLEWSLFKRIRYIEFVFDWL